MKKKKILISISSQFGYHTDTYMYCKYLDKTKYEVHYVGFDGGNVRRKLDNVMVHYIPVHGNKLARYWVYLSTINQLIRKENFDLLFLVDCQGSLLIRMSNLFRKTIMDIRTGNLQHSKAKRNVNNLVIRFTALFFKNISIISYSLQQKLHIPASKVTILPLGAELNDISEKKFDDLKLFYIGDLSDRRIDETVSGLTKFILKFDKKINITYDIVGFGGNDKIDLLNKAIQENNLEDIVTFHGRKNHDEVRSLFEKCNIGVVYVPITEWFDCQPTTKLYECLLAGMAVIATNTLENRLELKENCGVLIDDNSHSFAEGLKQIALNRNSYNSNTIITQYKASTWKNIVDNQLDVYFQKIIQQ